MPEPLRVVFRAELEQIDTRVIELFALVSEILAGATDALLSGDREAAHELVMRDALIDQLYRDIEHLVQEEFARHQPMAGDMRFLLSVLRIVPELERSGDLAEHVAQRAARGLARDLTPRTRGLLQQMGQLGSEMWRVVSDAYAKRDGEVAPELRELDDELDDLHVSLIAEAASGSMAIPVVIELALLARFYERLGDHAVNVARRVNYLVTGSVA
jgi:phosphate transport system protein